MKDEFKSFFACGSCEGQQLDWTIRIGPDRIDDLGMTSAAPELDLIDTLYDRILNAKPVTDLASPAVVKALESKTEAVRKEASGSDDPPTLGMLWDWKVAVEGQRTKLWMSTDDGGSYLFTIDTVAGKPRISTAEDLGARLK